MSNEEKKLPKQLLREAAEWYWIIRESDVSNDAVDQWKLWLSASPANQRAFEKIGTTLDFTDRIATPPWPTGEEMVADNYDGSISIKKWNTENSADSTSGLTTSTPGLSRIQSRFWAIAASLLLAVLIGAVYQNQPWSVLESPPDYVLYETQAAEHRDVALADGSSIALGGKSSVSVAYQDDKRIVLLQQGEAYFDVAKDESRPFVVVARGREITAVGTAFNVSNQQARVVVTVTEGAVVVAPETRSESIPRQTNNGLGGQVTGAATLEAGQTLIYDDQIVMPISIAEPGDALAWRNGLLKYRGEMLKFVVEDVNRYIGYPIVLGDPAVGEIQYTGTVFQESADTWVYGLEDAFSVAVSKTAAGVVVEERAQIEGLNQ